MPCYLPYTFSPAGGTRSHVAMSRTFGMVADTATKRSRDTACCRHARRRQVARGQDLLVGTTQASYALPQLPYRTATTPYAARILTCCSCGKVASMAKRLTTPASSALPRSASLSRCTSSISTSEICGDNGWNRRIGMERNKAKRPFAKAQPHRATNTHVGQEGRAAVLLAELAAERVQLLGGGAQQIRRLQRRGLRLRVTAQLQNRQTQQSSKPAQGGLQG